MDGLYQELAPVHTFSSTAMFYSSPFSLLFFLINMFNASILWSFFFLDPIFNAYHPSHFTKWYIFYITQTFVFYLSFVCDKN